MIFRRKAARDEAQSAPEADVAVELDSSRPRGPWDRSETTVDQGDASYVDLGGLLVKGSPGLELRLQVDEAQSTVSAVLLAGPRSGLELRAFAAPRHEGIWDDVRRDIAAEAVKRTPDGPLTPEIRDLFMNRRTMSILAIDIAWFFVIIFDMVIKPFS